MKRTCFFGAQVRRRRCGAAAAVVAVKSTCFSTSRAKDMLRRATLLLTRPPLDPPEHVLTATRNQRAVAASSTAGYSNRPPRASAPTVNRAPQGGHRRGGRRHAREQRSSARCSARNCGASAAGVARQRVLQARARIGAADAVGVGGGGPRTPNLREGHAADRGRRGAREGRGRGVDEGRARRRRAARRRLPRLRGGARPRHGRGERGGGGRRRAVGRC